MVKSIIANSIRRYLQVGVRARRLLFRGSLAIFALTVGGLVIWTITSPMIEISHFSETYPRRTEDLTANIVGRHHRLSWPPVWQLNGGPAEPVRQGWARAKWPEFLIEIPVDKLKPGRNEVVIETSDWMGRSQRLIRSFNYDDRRLSLPLKIDWSVNPLEVQDGHWEKVKRKKGTYVRPKPGFESYDRIALATGAFPINRRIETTVVFRSHILDRIRAGALEFGFGILSLWGGHPGVMNDEPREGWSFSLAWYWSKPGGAGNEISYRNDKSKPVWVGSYKDVEIAPDREYNVVIEVRRYAGGSNPYIQQRLKWWKAGNTEPENWLVTEDRE
ncbi:MAG: hypothetical protein OEM91_10125, partial [Hyphomicrobiales bacterium]|nr:hypothetical protein [Hyphomicrobiales bacterium]